MRYLFSLDMRLQLARLMLMLCAAALFGAALSLNVSQRVAAQSLPAISERVLGAEYRQRELDRVIERLTKQVDTQAVEIQRLQNDNATMRGLGMAFGAIVFLIQGLQVIWGRRNARG